MLEVRFGVFRIVDSSVRGKISHCSYGICCTLKRAATDLRFFNPLKERTSATADRQVTVHRRGKSWDATNHPTAGRIREIRRWPAPRM